MTRDVKGEVPEPRSSACLVPAFGGSKMVLFGGFIRHEVKVLSDIHILDLDTMVWTRGPNVESNGRARAACAVSNDQLIAWGGQGEKGSDNGSLDSTDVFNIKTNKWTTTYSAAPGSSSSTTPTEGPLTDNSQSSTPVTIIAAVALSVAGLVIVVGAVLLYRVHRRLLQETLQDPARKPRDPAAPFASYDNSSFHGSLDKDYLGHGPQEPHVNSNSVLGDHILKNPQRCTAQFPLQHSIPPEPHALPSPQQMNQFTLQISTIEDDLNVYRDPTLATLLRPQP
ncbi:hypothetical protein BGZ65_009059 [Modicella reniformis]|uniref:Uncharacterized protein n=1 Tax=Modicella reniformis TaxID=1440133 RepID=A0A9P6IND3_9FUNG|nr:hypothetical protein BGZ65_009059 [Modicella reniformis]